MQFSRTEFLQIALCSLGSGVPDGVAGSKTHRALSLFTEVCPEAKLDPYQYLETLYSKHAPTLAVLRCTCKHCTGYGNEKNAGVYRAGKPQVEAYYQYEYPGISLLTVWSSIMTRVVFPHYNFTYSSGYRCWNDNSAHGRTSTNHMGKAIDSRPDYDDSKKRQCVTKEVHEWFTTVGGMQIGWSQRNVLSFEPQSIAPTWCHEDCRQFDRKFIERTLVRV